MLLKIKLICFGCFQEKFVSLFVTQKRGGVALAATLPIQIFLIVCWFLCLRLFLSDLLWLFFVRNLFGSLLQQ